MSSVKDTTAERRSERETEPQSAAQAAPDRPSLDLSANVPSAESPAVDPLRIGYIGKRLGRFHIKAELGRGGMATVYRAHDPQLGRDVAVKVMHGFFAGRADIEARFLREANAVAAIRHPSILALYDFAPPAGEEPGYIVSELIEGPGLRDLVEARGGRLLPEIAANITIRVAEALGAAHAAGIVHRDVKPDNVLIDAAAGHARVVLTDFGVAHVSGMDTMTATGAVLGSPAYMSPEQARGEDVGPPSDVFSLGVMLYQLCTGHLPFSGKDPLAVISAILRGDYLRPGKVEGRVGPRLEQVITRCLQRDPAARFPDGAAMAAGLREATALPGVPDDDASLRRFLREPAAFEVEIAPVVAREALAAAEEARRRRQLPRALAEVGRALAYAPDDPAARQMLARLGSRGRSRTVTVGLVGATLVLAAVAVAGVAFLVPARSRSNVADGVGSGGVPSARVEGTPASVGATAPLAGARARPSLLPLAEPAVGPPPTVKESATPLASPAVQEGRGASAHSRTRRPQRPSRGPTSATMTSADVEPAGRTAHPTTPPTAAGGALADLPKGAGPLTTAPVGQTTPDPPDRAHDGQEQATAQATPQATGSMIVRASHGFCEPSVDDRQPSLRASYNDLTPGAHEIFCTLPQGAGKVRVATYNLRPGTRPSLIVVRGPDGRPTLGQPE